MTEYLEKLSFNYEDIVGIMLFTPDWNAFNYARPFGFYDEARLAGTPLETALRDTPAAGFIPSFENTIVTNTSHKNVFCYYRKIFIQREYAATLCVLIDSAVFERFLDPAAPKEETIAVTAGNSTVYPYTDASFRAFVAENELTGESPFTIGNEQYVCLPKQLDNGWQMSLLIPSERITTASNNITRQFLLWFALAFLLNCALISLIADKVASRLHKLQCNLSQVGSTRIYSDGAGSHIAEIAALGKQFDEMTAQIERLIQSVQEEQKQADRAQLEALRAQINPHFLYNTLDAINWMAIEADQDNISAMVSSLSKLFRYGLNQGNEITTLEQELSQLDQYLYIQSHRYNGQFVFEKEVPDALAACRIPNVILQPFVENCLLHGMRNIHDTIKITLSARRDGDTLLLAIRDDGAGCDAQSLNEYLASEDPLKKGYGAKNIHRRLRLYYGEAYGLNYLACAAGTCVEIRVPYSQEVPDV